MSREELDQSLDALRAEVAKLDESDSSKARLNSIITNVERHADDAIDDAEDESVVEQVQSHIEQFETEHPGVTGILNRIMVTLSNIGI